MKSCVKNIAVFVGGTVFGSLGFKFLKSRDAKKVYVHTTAAALRAKDCVMTDVTKARENCSDILAEAKELNEQKKADAACECEIIEDEAE